MILVTGGTGLVGAHLLFTLVKNGEVVTVIHRKESNLLCVKKVFSYYTDQYEILFEKINWIVADIANIPELEIAFKNITYVYHCAALISFNPKDYDQLKETNVIGTTNIVNLCIANGIKKLCYVSSVATIGKPLKNEIATEETEWSSINANVYALTKRAAEMEVWRGSQEGLSVVIVNPGVIIGPGFWKTGSGVLFSNAAKGRKYYPPGGTGFITVHDVVKMMVLLMDSSVFKERFIAVSKNLTYKEILSSLALHLDKKTPSKQLKFWQLELLWRLDSVVCFLSNKSQKLTKNSVISLRNRTQFSNEKIKETLDFNFDELDPTLKFSCAKFKEENP
ncbi:MAG: NAD-dependent epimerase/dehydratase family protein [Cellulophaga sp.]